MEGSILPGCAMDCGVYRSRRWSREQICPVRNTEPWAFPEAGVRMGVAVVLGIVAAGAVLEGQEFDVCRLVPAVDEDSRGGGGGVRHGAWFVLGQRCVHHQELLLPGQAGGAGGGDGRGPV